MHYCSLRYRSSDTNAVESIPATGISCDVQIVNSWAQVSLAQTFQNTCATPIEATYYFPVPASAAIHAFEFVRQDGTRVVGACKEKEQARQEYQEAVSQGQTAALGAEQTKDLFEISVGNIQSKETVVVKLSYAVQLQDDERHDEAKFVLPVSTFPRYGNSPSSNNGPLPSSTPCDIRVAIQQGSRIKKVSCPSSHPIQLEIGRTDLNKAAPGTPDEQLASVTLSQSSAIDKDFILVIAADGLDKPLAVVEARPSIEKPNSIALSLSFVPRFNVAALTSIEWIFVIDRSGSMAGLPMETAKSALLIAVKGLPTNGTSFNIFSFGSQHTSLFQKSQSYSQESLNSAVKDIDGMSADYGGTEIQAALEATFKSRDKSKPTNVVLFTDGGAWQVEQILDLVQTEVDAAPSPDAPLRVFTLGIGSGVSTELVEGIARRGNGASLFVTHGEQMLGKVNRLVKAARAPPIVGLSIHWTDIAEEGLDGDYDVIGLEEAGPLDAEKAKPAKVSLFTETATEEQESAGPPKTPTINPANLPIERVQQAPLKAPPLLNGIRYTVYAIIQASALTTGLPRQMTISGRVLGTGQEVELAVPITLASSFSATPVHTLAARKLIESAENGHHSFPTKIAHDDALVKAYLKAKIVDLGTTYGLTSSHTSFVAIDERSQAVIKSAHRPSGPQNDLLGSGQSIGGGGFRSVLPRLRTAAMPKMAAVPLPAPLAAAQFSGSANTGLVSGKSHSNSPTNQDKLTALAREQAFDGGFDLSPVVLSLLNLSAADAQQQVPGQDDARVVATTLVLKFMKAELAELEDVWEALFEKGNSWLEQKGLGI